MSDDSYLMTDDEDEDFVTPFDWPKRRRDDNTGEPISSRVVPETSNTDQHFQSAYQSVFMDVDYHGTIEGASAYTLADTKLPNDNCQKKAKSTPTRGDVKEDTVQVIDLITDDEDEDVEPKLIAEIQRSNANSNSHDEDVILINEMVKSNDRTKESEKIKQRFGVNFCNNDVINTKKRAPRFSQTQFSIEQILQDKKGLHNRNLNGATEMKTRSQNLKSVSATDSTAVEPVFINRAICSSLFTPDREDMPKADDIRKTVDAALNEVVRVILSLDLPALHFDYSEDLITEHLTKNGIITNCFKINQELPLNYESLDHYRLNYLPLIMYDCWAQVVEGYNSNHYGRLRMWHRYSDSETKKDLHFITIRLKGLAPSMEVQSEKYSIENWIVIIQPPPTEGGASHSQACLTDSTSNCKMALGFVAGYNNRINTFPDRQAAPAHLPFLGNISEEENIHSFSEIEYFIKISKTESNFKLISNQKELIVQPVYYFRPSMRHVEALSLMTFKKGFTQTFLKPEREVCQLDFCPPKGFSFFEEKSFNEQQKNAIVGCFNVVQQPHRTNKTVMIQGPPGTGKTHTLVGIVKNMFINCSDSKSLPLRILICAPSNGAIDEIALRLIRDRHFLKHFKEHKLRIVRIGQRSQVHPTVKPYLLETLVDQNFGFCQRARPKPEIRDELLLHANVILSTLNSVHLSCMNMFRPENVSAKKAIRCVIIDEASQSTEPELLMPLIYPVSKLILIGDHLQLPATVISRIALRMGYGRSMFERLFRHFGSSTSQNPMLSLCHQFRMHPAICIFPSMHFYNGILVTPPGIGRNPQIPIQPYFLFDVVNANERTTSSLINASKFNIGEAEFIFKLILNILKRLGYDLTSDLVDLPERLPVTIGVITFYRGQKQELGRRFDDFRGGLLTKHVDINTVDAFQGQERDIVILSCVRAFESTDNNSVGFVRSQQRMNVALTRAKSVLFICIHAKSFVNVPRWQQLINDAHQRNRFVRITSKVAEPALLKKISL